MKNRVRQRINRRYEEEMLNPKDECGVNDPTAYMAVRNIIKESIRQRTYQGKAKK